MVKPVRFGLVGTGHWARNTHARALASTAGVEFAAVWGRNADAAIALATEYGVAAFADIDTFFDAVDAVSFSVPPHVQSELAIRAATAGKHLLLEKPIATSAADADRLLDAVQHAGVASVVFFTFCFRPDVRRWIADAEALGGWSGGDAVWLGTATAGDNPFNTPWRRDKGALWDLGPHAISLLWATLGPVTGVTAAAGRGDVVHLVLHHDSGASSTVTVTANASDAASGFDLYVWGANGRSVAPTAMGGPEAALRIALAELGDNVRSGRTEHPYDIRLGHAIVHVLAQAQSALDIGGS